MSGAISPVISTSGSDNNDATAIESRMGRRPCFSVVVTTYNIAEYIGEAVESVLAQSDTDWELLIVDDGSQDATVSVLAQFDDPRIRVVRQSHSGLSTARRNGLSRVRGEYVVILDGDDRLRPSALAAFRRSFEADPGVGLVFGRRALCDEQGQVMGPPHRWRPRGRFNGRVLSRVLVSCPVTTPGQAAFRRPLLDVVGGYPIEHMESGDWYLCAIFAAVAKLSEIDDIVLDYRLRHDSLARNWGRRAQEMTAPNIDEFEIVIRQMYGSPLIQAALDPKDLNRLEKRSRAQAFCIKGYECLRMRYWSAARRYLWRGLRYYPLNATAHVCLALAYLKILPRFLRPSIGHE